MESDIIFQCAQGELIEERRRVFSQLQFRFPDAYAHWETMAIMAKALQADREAAVCELPFCHTVEGESFGGRVKYGLAEEEPRAGEPVCQTMEELLNLPSIDFQTGRIHEVLLACKHLREEGEEVLLNLSGPVTIANVLVDTMVVLKTIRKNPDLAMQVFWKIGEELLHYVTEAKKNNVRMISYGDSLASEKVLGPKTAREVTERFTYPFLKRFEEITNKEQIVLLCPKTVGGLLSIGKVDWKEVYQKDSMQYVEACKECIGRVSFAGQMCVKTKEGRLPNGILKEMILK